MVAREVTKKITDLPVYNASDANLSGGLHYREGGIDYQVPMTSFITATKTFAYGCTINSINEEVVYGGQRLVWTGTYPKTVPSGSTPDTTGGIGSGAWAYSNDSVLRENLRSKDGFKTIGKCASSSGLAVTLCWIAP